MENRPLLRKLGDNVRRLRKDRRLSLAEVSARMNELGVPLSLNGLSKVELGNRDLALDELAALSAALQVAPVVLVLPLGPERTVELFPGANVDTWAAVKWFTGEARLPAGVDASWDAESQVQASAASWYRQHDALVDEWTNLSLRLAKEHQAAASIPDGRGDIALAYARSDERPWLEQAVRVTEDQLRRHRADMRSRGFDPADLPPGAAHIDEMRG